MNPQPRNSTTRKNHRAVATLAVVAVSAVSALTAIADDSKEHGQNGQQITGVGSANCCPTVPSDNRFAPGFTPILTAQGIDALENPSGATQRFGYIGTDTRTEPDENTYLVLDHNPGGPTSGYDYGRHFLFQGHENRGNQAYITRINLDVANPDHRITDMTSGANGTTGFNAIDGSSWNPFTQALLFTQENGNTGGVIEMRPDWDSSTGQGKGLRTLYGSIGRGGFEGIHTDDMGNILIIEDAGGTTLASNVNSGAFAKNPNSFVYRFVPNNPRDLTHGTLQALQVSIKGQPVKFVPVDSANPTGDVLGANQLALHTVGASYPVRWVTVHDTNTMGTAPFDANAAAKAAGATPFKRPENAQFVPGTKFQSFIFDITGDTDTRASSQPALAARGSWGGLFRVDLNSNRNTGVITYIVNGDANHPSFDNLAFLDQATLLAAEDRGDTLHDQLNKLDSIWAYHIDRRVNNITATRFVALGQDRMAAAGDEDNEPTGLHYSDGDTSIKGLLGAKPVDRNRGQLFFTQQHGENNLFEVVTAGATKARDDGDADE